MRSGNGLPEPSPGKRLALGRVYVSKHDLQGGARGQYLEGVPPEVWNFDIGGYHVCEKWLKDRWGRTLIYDDLVSAPVEKSSSSAGLMSSRPMGGDAVINSIGVSICGEFFGHGSISTVPGRMNGLHSDPEPLDE